MYSSDDMLNSVCTSFTFPLGCSPTHMPCQYLCSHCERLFLKWSTIVIRFNGAETKCALILVILLLNTLRAVVSPARTARRVFDKHLRFIDIYFGQQQFAACLL